MKIRFSRGCVHLVAALLPAALAAQSAFTPHPELWPAATPAARDPSAEAFVEQVLKQMSLEDKIGQMIQADIAWIAPKDLRTYKLGSILAGGGSAPGGNVRTTAQAWLNLTDAFHRESLRNGSRPAIPILFGLDAVHGNAKLVGATIFPHNVGLGAAHDPDLVRRIGQATAQEVSAVGVDWTFAPTVAVVRDVRWGRSYESYSESPTLVAQYAGQMVTGLQGQRGTAQFLSPGHTLSSVKHYLGDGGTLAGRDQGETIVPESALSAIHAAGYPAAIKAGAMIVMASYNSWNGVKMHANHYLLTDILKGRLAFDGFVVGDWNAHEEIPGCTKYRCAPAILAGVDMLMAPDSWKAVFDNTLAQARSGEIPPARIDDAVRRILRVKAAAGLFERTAPQERADSGDFSALGNAAHRALAREAVRKSLVLLKNDHGTLPLNARRKILVAGEAADSIRDQTGGWTIDWQGDQNSNADFPGATSIYAGIKAAVDAAGGSVDLRADGQFSSRPDAAIVVFGESPYAEFEGDRENLEFSPGDQRDLQLLRKLRAAGVPTVAIFLSGRPRWVNPEINAADAFVAAWLPGSEGEGIADVLLRAPGKPSFDFSGRLSFSWPRTAMPVTFDAAGNASGVQFERGFGLDYQSKPTVLAPLSEDAAIAPSATAPEGSLFHAGHVTAPWSIFVADDSAEVHLTTLRQASPEGTVSVELAPDKGSVTGFWTGKGSGDWRFSGRAADLRMQAQHGAVLTLRYRVDRSPENVVKVGMLCAEPLCGSASGAMLDLTAAFKTAAPGMWQTISIPLSRFAAAGADLKDVVIPLAIETSGRFILSISEARMAPRSESGTPDPGS
ncbi:MAG TPA: glycoside hydrolase family 3 N-terminal domain-containing protein [Steroidobacteraceae bacterium]|jgi:beta-glucosidase